MSDSNITISGNLTRDPELRFTAGGSAVANIGVAVAHRYQKHGEWVDETSFINAVVWNTLGENAAASLRRGDRVIIVGRPTVRQYETTDGEKRSAFEIVVEDIGPSLRWGTTTFEKVARASGDQRATSSPSAPGVPARAADPIYGDEEPF